MKRPLAAALAALVAASSAVVMPTANAGPGDGTLTVKVIRDVNGNGTYEAALEVGVPSASVLVTDPAGATATGTTDAQGNITVGLDPVSGGKYRVQVTPPAGSVLQPAPAGTGLESNTMFVDVSGAKDVSVTTALWNPADYCQSSPELVTACQRATRKQDGSSNVDDAARSLVTFPFTNRGSDTAPTQIANQGVTGAVYGIAYRKQDKRVFSGAYAKRLTDYGIGGSGGIYVTPAAGGPTTLFTTVPDAGTTAHDHEDNFDGGFANVVGKEALGDIDISEDGSELYVVNLGDRKLYVYDATAATAGAAKASYAIPSPCADPVDWRPGALAVRDGMVYVGGVCTGESTQSAADMRVVVRTFSAGAFSEPVVDQPLTYLRGTVLWQGSGTDHWMPWQATYAQPTPFGGLVVHPEPLLTDIGVEAKGDLVLAFRDRFGDQGGDSLSPADGSPGLWDTVSGGDLNRVCRQDDGSYAWEGTATCPNNNNAANNGNGQSADVVEYYPGEYFKSAEGSPHNETAQGALAVVHGETRMPNTVMDPTALNTGGVGWFDRTNGTMAADGYPNAYQISDADTEGWAKANGLADLEALCDLAPVQLGNRVWFDTDGDGTQDGDEPAIAGVKVTATPCAGGAALPVKTTDAKGEYYFGEADGLKPETCYDLAFDYSGVNAEALPGAPTQADLKWTTKEAGPDRVIDSNVDAEGKTQATTGTAGTADHTIDAGIRVTNKLGDYVWVDENRDGVQQDTEVPVPGVTVVLKKGDGTQVGQPKQTDAEGEYVFDNLPDGTYKVCFDIANLPEPYKAYLVTRPDAGDDDEKDSDAGADGCTPDTTLGSTKREDMTLDLGIRPPNKLGDFVWIDTDKNGLQDDGEPDEVGVPGVTVKLGDKTTTTDENGKYEFPDLPDGTYKVCFDIANLPDAVRDYQVTKPNAGDVTKDSNADVATGCTPEVELNVDKPEDLTIDMGLISPVNRLGDYVWIDVNKDGLQDATDVPVEGVTVTLNTGATTKTNAEGKYLFNDLPDGTYTVCFDIANLPDAVQDYKVTTQNAGDNDAVDSDAGADGCTAETMLNIDKREDLTLDMGLVAPPNRIGDFVWSDQNRNGVQDSGEPGVPGVPVKLVDDKGNPVGQPVKTDENGNYEFPDLPDGTYKVCFEMNALPGEYAGYLPTKPNVGDDAKDSDADLATGCTPPVTVRVGKRENLTLDLGIVSPTNRVGDYVWYDNNSDGVQDANEPGVPGLPVFLQDGTGKPVAETKTDKGGRYLFADLPDGEYKVCFNADPQTGLVAGRKLTTPHVGDDAKDSDADLANGCTHVVKLGPNKRVDLTLDAGLLPKPPLATTGATVWGWLAAGLALLLGGAFLSLLGRRRKD